MFGDRLPHTLRDELDALAKRLGRTTLTPALRGAPRLDRRGVRRRRARAGGHRRRDLELGCLGTIVVGVLGGLIGGWLFSLAGDEGIGDFGLRSMFVAFVGAVVLLADRRPRSRRRPLVDEPASGAGQTAQTLGGREAEVGLGAGAHAATARPSASSSNTTRWPWRSIRKIEPSSALAASTTSDAVGVDARRSPRGWRGRTS